jgi:hypothetical protein
MIPVAASATSRVPSFAQATSIGYVNVPFSSPASVSHRPSRILRMRALPMSATTSEPSFPSITACGERKSASPAFVSASPCRPGTPARVETLNWPAPKGVSRRIVWFSASATATTPAGETATP